MNYTVDGGSTASYAYDGNHLRVQKTISGATTAYVYSNAKVIAEYTGGALSKEYIYSGSQLLATVAGNIASYQYPDHLSTRLETDSSGNVTRTFGHLPFGEAWYETGVGSNWKFTTYERNAETGLDYATLRYDCTRLGRFMSPDLLNGDPGNPQSLNRYVYSLNDPVNLIDPLGLCPKGTHQVQPSQQMVDTANSYVGQGIHHFDGVPGYKTKQDGSLKSIDCSHLMCKVEAGERYSSGAFSNDFPGYQTANGIASTYSPDPLGPRVGDIVAFYRGGNAFHVAIVSSLSPFQFIGSQTSNVAEAQFDNSYWKQFGKKFFLPCIADSKSKSNKIAEIQKHERPVSAPADNGDDLSWRSFLLNLFIDAAEPPPPPPDPCPNGDC